MTQLSLHFSLKEFTDSDIAARNGIDNTAPPELMANLRRTAGGMERVRSLLGDLPIRVNSGYRCENLERVLCAEAFVVWCKRQLMICNNRAWQRYFLTKQHPSGNAVDFTCEDYGLPYQIMQAVANSAIDYDQLILEYNSWVHISFASLPRHQALVIDKTGTRKFE